MLRWLLRALAFLAVASIFTMHGASADGVTHAVAPTTTADHATQHGVPEHRADGTPARHDHRSHLHHLAMVCVAVLATVAAVVARRRPVVLATPATRTFGLFARAREAIEVWRPPPVWLELGVTLR